MLLSATALTTSFSPENLLPVTAPAGLLPCFLLLHKQNTRAPHTKKPPSKHATAMPTMTPADKPLEGLVEVSVWLDEDEEAGAFEMEVLEVTASEDVLL